MGERSVLTPARRGASHVAPNTMKPTSLPEDSVDAEKPSGSTDSQQKAICSSLLSRSQADPGCARPAACPGQPGALHGPAAITAPAHAAPPAPSALPSFALASNPRRLLRAILPGSALPRPGQRRIAAPALPLLPRPRPRRAPGPAAPRGASEASARGSRPRPVPAPPRDTAATTPPLAPRARPGSPSPRRRGAATHRFGAASPAGREGTALRPRRQWLPVAPPPTDRATAAPPPRLRDTAPPRPARHHGKCRRGGQWRRPQRPFLPKPQRPVRPAFEHRQEWGIHSFPRQPAEPPVAF